MSSVYRGVGRGLRTVARSGGVASVVAERAGSRKRCAPSRRSPRVACRARFRVSRVPVDRDEPPAHIGAAGRASLCGLPGVSPGK
ncbi:hypothetical protein WT60_13625 [Burkholderia sp. MSMB617WGS]|uniref:Uncharacterized protein n=1 Tax=Burkholderia savannae TaxID=1637837 RepID=A0ABR5TFS0_9BURK|nr:hypothetical protein WT60_13625 [Burkholderia sp. MSMB617WGS]KVK90574.1 hypothetical protein WS91_26000 [Burkholderia sp. MSMB1498]KWZ41035.1 hypothetical protein WS73_27570 [Burkholderia savannae]KWZ43831.1 hypothetical protein WS72_13835 [Burkholderia savannae]